MCKVNRRWNTLLQSGLLVVGVWSHSGLVAQYAPPKKAQKRLTLAVEHYMRHEVSTALELVDEALEVAPEFAEAWMLKSQLMEERQAWAAAAESMQRALEYDPELRVKWHRKLIRLNYKAGAYSEALELLQASEPHANASREDSLLDASIKFASEAVLAPLELELKRLTGDVNSSQPEYYPALFATGDRMIFTRQMGESSRMTGQEDFFEAKRAENGDWNVIRALTEINTLGNEGAPSVRGDGRQLIFTACAGVDGRYTGRSGEGSCDLFESEWSPNARRYVHERNITELNSRAWESQPSLSADGHWLYFVRAYRTDDGKVIQDIYEAEWQGTTWGRPHRLPATINTPGREENPVLHADGKTLYFASDGHAGMGGMDLYVSRRDSAGNWAEAVNLGFPINTSADENSLQVFPDGTAALFATDRMEPGNLDLWQFTLPEFGKAEEIALWRGEVVEARSGLPISATVQVFDRQGIAIGYQISDLEDGQFTLTFASNQEVTLQVEQAGYAFFSKRVLPQEFVDPFVRIELTALTIGTVMVLTDVRFARSSSELDVLFQPDLEQLARTMLQSDIRIRIIGHTDGEGSEERNQALSEDRARSVAAYLQALGVNALRMETLGMGENQPIASNDTEEGRAQNRRTEILVIE